MSRNEHIKKNSNFLRGELTQDIQNVITGSVSENSHDLIKFHGIYEQDDRDRRNERAKKKLEKLYSFMIRLRIPGGRISAKEWVAINTIARKYSTNVIKVTTRQTVQLHGVCKRHLKPMIQEFAQHELDSIATCGDVNRNVICSAINDDTKVNLEIYHISKQISEHLLPQSFAYNDVWLDSKKLKVQRVNGNNPSSQTENESIYGNVYLPRKFKIAIAIPPFNDVDVYAHDIGLVAIIENEELIGFNILVGGGMGNSHDTEHTFPRLGDVIGFVDKDNILDAVEKIVIIQRDFGNREDRTNARLKYTIEKFGIIWFQKQLENLLGYKLEKAKDFKLLYRSDILGWKQDYQGKHNFTLFVETGLVSDSSNTQLRSALFEIAQKELADFHFTNNQNIILNNIDTENKQHVEDILNQYAINNDGISQFRNNSLACVALNTCPQAVAEGQRYLPSLITKIEELLTKYDLQDNSISIRMTGCPNGCARPYLSEIALVGKSLGIYNMYIGSDSIGTRLNRLYKENLDESGILKEIDMLFSNYAKQSANQSFGDFVFNTFAVSALSVASI